jgi:multiple sugar transport system substrate-binding protein
MHTVRNTKLRSVAAGFGVLAVAAAALTGCSTTASSSTADSGKTVHLTFTNWDGGMQTVVDEWNKENPKIQVKLIKPSGTGYTLYNKLITNNKAGTNPDVSEVEYQALPALISNKVVVSLNKYLPNLSKDFSAAALAQVEFQGKTYGVPQNACPMVFFYRKDIFEKDGITSAPTTWAQYAADAAIIHAKDPAQSIGNFDAADAGWFAGLAQQAGANWWTTSGSTWNVSINDPATVKVADFWQDLVTKGLVNPEPNWSAQWDTDLNQGNLVGWVSAQWAPNQFPGVAKDTAGKWVAAALPAWTAGDQTVGIWGGETEAVTSNSKYPAQAAKFVDWMNGSTAGITSLIKNVAVFPASTPGQALPALNTPPAYMSNQPGYNKLVAKAASHVRTFQIWGPDANVTFDSYSDAFATALQNKTPLAGALDVVQSATVADMKKIGFTVTTHAK